MRYAKFVYGSFQPDFSATGWGEAMREAIRKTMHEAYQEGLETNEIVFPPVTPRQSYALWRWRAYRESIPFAEFREVQR